MTPSSFVWYAVYTRPRAEGTARDNLLRQGYSAYLPRCRIVISHARRRQSVLRPLFPRYLFAGVDRASMRWRPILSTRGVSGVVRAGDEPVPVPAGLVAALRAQEAAGLFNRIAARPALKVGELVRVTVGAFQEMVGQLIEMRDQDRVVVLLELLGRKVRAQLESAAVEAA
jgi:transcriptional antiterminator RfaH